MSLSTRALGDPILAEDAMQEAAVQAMLALDRLKRPGSFGPWLAGIALNICGRWMRERARDTWSWEAALGGRAGTWAPPHEPIDPEDAAQEAEFATRVRRAVTQLPPGQREAVTLFYLTGLTGREVAATLGIGLGAAKTRLHKARANLQRRLLYLWREDAVETQEGAEWVTMHVADVRRKTASEEAPTQHVVLLQESGGDRRLPIWIGQFEATSLALALENVEMARPGAYQFTANVLGAAGGRLREVHIERLEGGTFFAVAIVEGSEGTAEVDSRPSDAMNMAVLQGLPIKVRPDVLEAMEAQASRRLTAEGARAAYPEGASEIAAETQRQWEEQMRSFRGREGC